VKEVRKNMTYKLKELCKAKCKNRKVDFSQNNLGYYSCRIISKIILKEDRISVLNLSNNNIGNKGAELIANAIKNTVTLVSLNLSSNSITHVGGEILFKALKLQESIIDFNISSSEGTNRNRISYFGLKDIESVFNYNLFLENFNISGNGIKNEGISKIFDGLNKNQTLHFLDISHNDINSVGIENSFPKLKICKLIELNISENRIGDDGLIILTNALKNFPKIHILKIANCGFEFKGFLFLCSHLIDMKRITTLDVSGNDIKSRKFEQIKQYFMGFGVINLNISNCSLGDKSSYILGECLCLNETIKKVKICENKISDNGFRTFIPLFKTNSTIENFDISRNFITDESAEEFIENIRYNRNLKHLNLFDNQLKNEMGNLLVDILSHNKTLLTVNVGFNRIPIKVIDEINKKLKVNEEKIKSKFIPNLVKQIKENNIHPEMFRFLTKKIKHSQTYQSYISEKLKEDEVMFKQLKIEESDKLKNAIKLNENLEINIKKYDLQLKIVIAEIKKLKDQIKIKSNEINELIEKLKEDIKNKTKKVNNL
jgi:Ran GTPase-activating protein (RanGAP) involved in mRNA processing and transport